MSEQSKAELADEILGRMGDMHSHYDIEPRGEGFGLVRTFEIEDKILAEMGLPDEQVFYWRPTLNELQDIIINQEGPFVGMEKPTASSEELGAQRAREAELGSAERGGSYAGARRVV